MAVPKVPPKVFISYSHDSADHKQWVLDFATTLRGRGIDAILDQWDLVPGADVPRFMEQNLRESDFVLMVCTPRYVEKANAGEGGVGYERMIVTADLMRSIDNKKFIPVICKHGEGSSTPIFLASKFYVDFSNSDGVEASFDELLRSLTGTALFEKPEIGSQPLARMGAGRPDRTSDGLKALMTSVAASFASYGYSVKLYSRLVEESGMHQLKFDHYLELAIDRDLVFRSDSSYIGITDEGRKYIFEHGIVDL
ncbi:toll/interleukin-1 receptor domain-containing protein [Congregibacter litoralis]|uniref:SEFIR domain protein n=1 Tax=Congregibacter litoralis KT71 TaxID=314285 RepID=A4ACG4_9GAMM|nr:toll/interleukin-1 receptor domain-containing protein [Congregibacter litoralis]EAQ96392.1 SEFIR domain protein [Congregibacter litoralis KT71]